MCFSTTASFVAGGGLIAIGSASLKQARKRDILIAAIPLFFGIQQILEGLQWTALNAQQIAKIPLYGFLFFASVLWPVYVPLTAFFIDKKRQKITKWFVCLGGLLSLVNLWYLVTTPATAQITNHSIQYLSSSTNPSVLFSTVYLLVTCGPFLISSIPAFRLLGVVTLLSIAISYYFFSVTFVSVWCFFAAIVSSIIYFYIRNHNKLQKKTK